MKLPSYSHFIVKKHNLIKTNKLNKWRSLDFKSKLQDSKTHGLNHFGLLSGDLKWIEVLSYLLDRLIIFFINSCLFFSVFSHQYHKGQMINCI